MCPGCGVEGAVSTVEPFREESGPLEDTEAELGTLAESSEEIAVVRTGIDTIDSLLRGFPTGVSATIHGNRGAGKSTLSLQIAAGLAENLRSRALVVAPEMSRKILEYTARFVSDRSRLVPVDDHRAWRAAALRARARVLVIDSVTVFRDPGEVVDEAIAWARDVDGIALLLSQQNSDGQPLGRGGVAYNPDAVFEVRLHEDGSRSFSVDGKCRWAPLGSVRL